MALLRQQFSELSSQQLVTLISSSIKFLSDVTRFESTQKQLNEISQLVKNSSENKEMLRTILRMLMGIISYWDDHQDQKGHFPLVLKNIVATKLQEILNVQPQAKPTLK